MKLKVVNNRAQILTETGVLLVDVTAKDTKLNSQADMIVKALSALLSQKCMKYNTEKLEILTDSKLLLSLDKGSTVTESYKPYIHTIMKHIQVLPFESISIIYDKSVLKVADEKTYKVLTTAEAFNTKK